MKNLQELTISADSVDSLCIMNLQNQQKVEKTLKYSLIERSNLKNSIKKNKKYSRITNFHWFRGFALHYESAELTESWENFVFLLTDKRLNYILTELKLVPNLQKSRKLNQAIFLLKR